MVEGGVKGAVDVVRSPFRQMQEGKYGKLMRYAFIGVAVVFWITACGLDSDLSTKCYDDVEVDDPDSNTPKQEWQDNGKCSTSYKRNKSKDIIIMYIVAALMTGTMIGVYHHAAFKTNAFYHWK